MIPFQTFQSTARVVFHTATKASSAAAAAAAAAGENEKESTGLIEMVAEVARVSNPGNQHNHHTAPRLIQFLIREKHWSPFEMVNIVMEINTTRDIARQILRHRSFSFQEFSQRYASVDALRDANNNADEVAATATATATATCRELRFQDVKNRQHSLEQPPDHMELDVMDLEALRSEWNYRQDSLQKHATETYAWALQNGIAKEQARVVLPEGLTPSRLYMNGTLRSWIHYIELRTHISTQKEHRIVALQCAEALKPLFPMIDQFVDNIVRI